MLAFTATFLFIACDNDSGDDLQTDDDNVESPFVFTVETTSANQFISFSTYDFGGVVQDYSVDWGDGSTSDNESDHYYVTPAVYTIKISGVIPRMKLEFSEIQSLEAWGTNKWQSVRFMFTQETFDYNATDTPDLTEVTNLYAMFLGTSFVTQPDLSSWDVSNITEMQYVFSQSNFNGDINDWDVSNVTDMTYMFGGVGSSFNGDISDWDVSSVTSMNYMFGNSSFNTDISGWDVSSVTDMYQMFYNNDDFEQDLSDWDTSSVTSCDRFNVSATQPDTVFTPLSSSYMPTKGCFSSDK